MKKLKIILSVLLLTIFTQNIKSQVAGDWGCISDGSWSGTIWATHDGSTGFVIAQGTPPPASANVWIPFGFTVSLSAGFSCQNLDVAGTLNITSGGSLNANNATLSGGINLGSNNLTVTNNLLLNSGGYIQFSTGTITCKNFESYTSSTLAATGAGVMNISGNWTNNGGTKSLTFCTTNFTSTDGLGQIIGGTENTSFGYVVLQENLSYNNFVTLNNSMTTFTKLDIQVQLNANSNTINLGSTGDITITSHPIAKLNINSGVINCRNLTNNRYLEINGSTTVNISGNFDNQATFSQGTSTFIFTGGTSHTLGGFLASDIIFNTLQIQPTATVTLTHDISCTNLTLNGTLDIGTNILNLGLNNLTINSGGRLDANGQINCANFIMQFGSIFNANGSTIYMTGDWINNGGTLNSTTFQSYLTGSGDQTIGGSTPSTFYNLTINSASGIKSISSETTVLNQFYIFSGTFQTGANKLSAKQVLTLAGTTLDFSNGTLDMQNFYKFNNYGTLISNGNSSIIYHNNSEGPTDLMILPSGVISLKNLSVIDDDGSTVSQLFQIDNDITITGQLITNGARCSFSGNIFTINNGFIDCINGGYLMGFPNSQFIFNNTNSIGAFGNLMFDNDLSSLTLSGGSKINFMKKSTSDFVLGTVSPVTFNLESGTLNLIDNIYIHSGTINKYPEATVTGQNFYVATTSSQSQYINCYYYGSNPDFAANEMPMLYPDALDHARVYVEIFNTAGVTMSKDITISDMFVIRPGGKFTVGPYTLTARQIWEQGTLFTDATSSLSIIEKYNPPIPRPELSVTNLKSLSIKQTNTSYLNNDLVKFTNNLTVDTLILDNDDFYVSDITLRIQGGTVNCYNGAVLRTDGVGVNTSSKLILDGLAGTTNNISTVYTSFNSFEIYNGSKVTLYNTFVIENGGTFIIDNGEIINSQNIRFNLSGTVYKGGNGILTGGKISHNPFPSDYIDIVYTGAVPCSTGNEIPDYSIGCHVRNITSNISTNLTMSSNILVEGDLTLSGTFNISDKTLTLGGNLNVLADGSLIGGNMSRLSIINTSNSNINLSIAQLKTLEIDRLASEININSDLNISDTLSLKNATLNFHANTLTLGGYIYQENSFLKSTQYGTLNIEGSNPDDCYLNFYSGTDSRISSLNLNRIDGKIHLASDLTKLSELNLYNGKLYLNDHNLYFSSCPFLYYDNSFNVQSYIVTNGTGSVILRNCNTKGPTVFPIGSDLHFAPVEINANYVNLQYYNISARYFDMVENVADTSNWLKNSWEVSVVPDNAGNEVDYSLTTYWGIDSEGSKFNSLSSYITAFDGTSWDVQPTTSADTNATNGLKYLTRPDISNNGIFSVTSCNLSTAPDTVIANIDNYCLNDKPDEVILTYINGEVTNCGVSEWYSDKNLTNYIGSANNLSLTEMQLPDVTTTYYLVYNDGFNPYIVDSVTIVVNQQPIINLTCSDTDLMVCDGDNLSFTGSGGTTYDFYVDGILEQSSLNNIFETNSFTNDFSLSMEITDLNSCTNTTSLNLTVFEYSETPVTLNTTFCSNTPELTLSFSGNPASDAVATWYNDVALAVILGYGNNLNITNLPETNHTYYIQFSGYCNTTSAVPLNVIVNQPPAASISTGDADFNFCIGESITLIGGGGTIYDYYLNNVYFPTTNSTLEIQNFETNTDVMLIVRDANLCSDTTYLYLTALPLPELDIDEAVTITLGENYTLNANGNTEYSYYWTPFTWMDNQNIYNPTVTPEDTITYTVEITDIYGCKSSYNVKLDIEIGIIIYDAVSPNNDGKNDYFYIKNIERFEECSLEIFDRNGNSVYKTVNYKNNWGGTNEKTGEVLPFGTYFYVLDLNIGVPIYKGTFMIFR